MAIIISKIPKITNVQPAKVYRWNRFRSILEYHFYERVLIEDEYGNPTLPEQGELLYGGPFVYPVPPFDLIENEYYITKGVITPGVYADGLIWDEWVEVKAVKSLQDEPVVVYSPNETEYQYGYNQNDGYWYEKIEEV